MCVVDLKTDLSMREIFRLVLVALGVVSLFVGSIWGLVLLTARTEYGVVEVEPILEHGETTNVAYVVSKGGMHVRLQPEDQPAALKAGDSIPILRYGKGGTVKFGRRFWGEWRVAGTFVGTGVALILCGLYVLRHRRTFSQVDATQPV
jgi:hypothetical protein